MEMDSDRKLIFLGDNDRIKSFSWGPDAEGKLPKRLPNVHTMNSGRAEYDGPLAILPDGRLARAGKGKMAIWNLDTLEKHQDNPGTLIGEGTVNLDYSWRDSHRRIERSSGSKADSVVAFAYDPEYEPGAWHWHAPSQLMLCAEKAEERKSFACISMDVERGQRVARYLGHGYEVERFATSVAEPNVFWTAGGDGYARMFDVRRPLPVLTFDTGVQSEACADIVYIHPDAIPGKSRLSFFSPALQSYVPVRDSTFHGRAADAADQDVGCARPRVRVRAIDGEQRRVHVALGRPSHDSDCVHGIRTWIRTELIAEREGPTLGDVESRRGRGQGSRAGRGGR